jgi:hypothetical protein
MEKSLFLNEIIMSSNRILKHLQLDVLASCLNQKWGLDY